MPSTFHALDSSLLLTEIFFFYKIVQLLVMLFLGLISEKVFLCTVTDFSFVFDISTFCVNPLKVLASISRMTDLTFVEETQ